MLYCVTFYANLRRDAKVVFIPKIGKDKYDEPKSFRLISLTNYLLKGLERLCCWSMDIKLANNPIHSRQHGFLSNKSTETAISEVTDMIEGYIHKKKHCIGDFLDIKSAFDTIDPMHIHRSLLKFGAEVDMADWYLGYLRGRKVVCSLPGCTLTL